LQPEEALLFFPKQLATLGVLTGRVKAWCSFEVVSAMGGKFDDPYSTKLLDLPFLTEVSHETWTRDR